MSNSPNRRTKHKSEKSFALLPLWAFTAAQNGKRHHKPTPGGTSEFWRELGIRFQSLRDARTDEGDTVRALALSRMGARIEGTKLWHVKGSQDSVGQLLRLWREAESEGNYPKPDPKAPYENSWLSDVLSHAIGPIDSSLVRGQALEGGRLFDGEHAVLLVRDYCIAAIEV